MKNYRVWKHPIGWAVWAVFGARVCYCATFKGAIVMLDSMIREGRMRDSA